MQYNDTWFGQQPMSIYGGGFHNGRPYFLHRNVIIPTGEMVPMHRKDPDGSIAVLGARQIVLNPGFITGSRDKKALQRSLARYANELAEKGATIVRLTPNTLTARHERETLKVEISDIKRPRL